MAKPRVVALVRFSFIDGSGASFVRTRGLSLDERVAEVMRPDRLARRFDIFEAFALPSFRVQPSDDFLAIVLASDAMPQPYQERLADLLAGSPHLVAAFEPPGRVMDVFGALAAAQVRHDAPVAFCRVDDDDALAGDFTEQMAAYVGDRYLRHCVSLADGLEVQRVGRREGDADLGESVMAWRRNKPKIGAGLAYVADDHNGPNIFSLGNHMRVCEHVPTVVDSRKPAFLLTRHGENDSKRKPRPDQFPASEIFTRAPGSFDFLARDVWRVL